MRRDDVTSPGPFAARHASSESIRVSAYSETGCSRLPSFRMTSSLAPYTLQDEAKTSRGIP